MTLSQRTKKQVLASQLALKRRQNNEAQLEKELGRFFKRLKKSVLKELNEYWSDYQLLQGQVNLMLSPVHEAHKEYYEIIRKYKLREYELGKAEAKRLTRLANKDKVALKAATTLGIQGFVDKDKNNLFGTIPRAEQDLLNRTFRASENTLNRVDNQLNQIISDGYREGKGINKVANDITKRFDQLADWEARRIARTEINTSHNQATRDQYKEDGVEYTQWIAANDDRTRDSHADVDGEIIPIDGKYSNGLAFPGDTSGPFEEWINCRCSNAPFVIPYGFIAPSFSPFRESDLVPINTESLMNKPIEEENWVNTYTVEEGSTFNTYTLENGTQITVDHETNLTFEMLQDHLNSLPSDAKLSSENLAKIEIKATNKRSVNGEFNIITKTLIIYNNNHTVGEKLDTFNHELTHAKDGANSKYFKLSSIEEYEKIVQEDNKLYKYTAPNGKERIPYKPPTDYAGRSYVKYNKKYKTNLKTWKKGSQNPALKPHNQCYVEDFADSGRLYLNESTHAQFVKEFPNRAKYLEGIYGKPKFK